MPTIFSKPARLHQWMDEPEGIPRMQEEDRRLSEILAEDRARLRDFIRRRVPNEADAEDLLQDVFYEAILAYRLMKPVERWGAWMFQVARNRIIDRFRKKRAGSMERAFSVASLDGAELLLEDILPSLEGGPEAAYARNVLMEALEEAIDELPEEQRAVFIAHEIEGLSMKEISHRTGAGLNTVLSRKRYAVLHLRDRLQSFYDEFDTGE
jgi:RNA polymerase sigma factor (sigma-70 family)